MCSQPHAPVYLLGLEDSPELAADGAAATQAMEESDADLEQPNSPNAAVEPANFGRGLVRA